MRRRTWLLSAAGTGGALVVGWGLMPPRARVGAAEVFPREAVRDGAIAMNGWVAVGPGDDVSLAMPRSEMGQGVHTALAMLVAEELELPVARVRLVDAGGDRIFGNVAALQGTMLGHPGQAALHEPGGALRAAHWMLAKVAGELGLQLTGASASVADAWGPVRRAAATARAQLLGAASLQWRLPVDELVLADGLVRHPSGLQARLAELAPTAALTPSGDVRPKPPGQWSVIGRPQPRLDVPAKCDGRAVFGLDVRLPGLLFAVMRHPLARDGRFGAVDPAPALALPGIERVVQVGSWAGSTPGVAVVGRSTWHALRGAQALQLDSRPPPAGGAHSGAILDRLSALSAAGLHGEGGLDLEDDGNVDAAWAAAPPGQRVEAHYRVPYLAHAALEPPNATARVHDGRVEVWAPTQVPGFARRLAAEVAGVPEEAVTLHVTYLGGGFGRRLETDVVGQAVRVALEAGGRPVQLMWTREDDLRHDLYRPAAAASLRAVLAPGAADGPVAAWQAVVASDAVTPRHLARVMPLLAPPVDLPDKTAVEGLVQQPYGFGARRTTHVATRSGVPVGYWRSVGHSMNAFFVESFVDELAHAAGADPVAFRLALLRERPAHAAVLRLAAEVAGWGRPPGNAADGAPQGRGVALHESFGSVVAMVAELSLARGADAARGRPRVHRVVCAVDVGTVVQPDTVRAQVMSGVVWGLAAALHGHTVIDAGVASPVNFDGMVLPRLADTPAIEVHLVRSRRPPGGAGEIGVPPVAPALANALHALTGVRRRALPLVG